VRTTRAEDGTVLLLLLVLLLLSLFLVRG